MSMVDLDALDLRIIARLSGDARVSNREIAREFDLTEGTIRSRLKKLMDRRVLRVTAVTNVRNLKNPILAHLWIDVDTSTQLSSVADSLAALEKISFVSILLGRADILAMMLVRDAGELATYLHQTIDQIPGIHRIQYSLAHQYMKHDYRYTVNMNPAKQGAVD